ncbi:hypothetical protein Hypma_010932 [Hypsizygus marmoreus]|uniref:EamA domain-containing protein n=1 Tax=Hypsizygus marmoreus TaxID=39966 RepID=A0A369JSJ4_HYPMA|nr:hypothetical protein Hypma_010932 [Hypsizygus marmoreus]
MSSRNAYAALTPDYSDFSVLHTTGASSSSAESEPSTPPGDLTEDEGNTAGRWRSGYLAVKGIVRNNAGLLLITASQAFFSCMNTAVKKLNSIDPPVPTLELIVVRMGITYLCSMSYMLYAKVPDPWLGPKGVRLLLVFRGFSGFFGLFGIYYSLQYLSLSDATVLTFLAPLCTGIAGAIFLKENFTKTQALASVCSLFGVVLIARPVFLFRHHSPSAPEALAIHVPEYLHVRQLVPDPSEKGTPEQRLIAVGVALIGVLGSTGAYTSITAIGKRAHPLHAMTSFSLQCVIVATVGMLVQGTTFVIPTRLEWLALLLMIGIFGFIAQFLLTMGLQRETAGRGSTAVYTQVVFAAILERLFFRTVLSILSVLGTLIIISSALYVAMTKERKTKMKPSVIRLGGITDETLEEGLLENNTLDEEIKGRNKEEEPISTPHRQKFPRTRSESGMDETSVVPSSQDKGKETST